MDDILDLERYPIHESGSSDWIELVDRCRGELADSGMFNLEGFMRPSIAAVASESLLPRFASDGYRHEREHNIYFAESVDGLSSDHPALTRFHTSNVTLCDDQLQDTPMDRLYRWPAFSAFLAATLDKTHLYPMNDPLAGLNVMAYHEGQSLNWHFDRSEFTTTLLLQAPEVGGEFFYHTDLRSENNPNYAGVAKLITEQDPNVRRLTLSPGTINVFRGKNTPHRVSEIRGSITRIIAVFSFYEAADRQLSDAERVGFYGRSS